MYKSFFILIITFTFISLNVSAQINVGSDASDGILTITEDTTIDLGQAANGTWDMASPVAGNGVYDADKWVVVFKYQSVTIEPDVTLTFENHPANPPVIWLVQGDVIINGNIDISGQDGGTPSEPLFYAEPGPGGFRGGHRASIGVRPSAGMGPGGALTTLDEDARLGTGGSYATQSNQLSGQPGKIYGNPAIFPLIGGSGGEGGYNPDDTGGGGAGGGAILIASNNTIIINGTINANGGERFRTSGSGSGGAIKLIANRVDGNGQLTAYGPNNWEGKAGDGRIRIESNENSFTSTTVPPFSAGDIVLPLKIVPVETTPQLNILSVNGDGITNDPHSELAYPNVDMLFNNEVVPNPVQVGIETLNVPTSATVTIQLKTETGISSSAIANLDQGDQNQSIWFADVTLPESGHFTIQAIAEWD